MIGGREMKCRKVIIGLLGNAIFILPLYLTMGNIAIQLSIPIAMLTLAVNNIWCDHRHDLLTKELKKINELFVLPE